MTTEKPDLTRFFGLDIHKHYLVAVGVDPDGVKVYGPRRVAWVDLDSWRSQTLTAQDAVVVEMTTNTWQVYDELLPYVHSVTVVHPPHVRLVTQPQVMTDKIAVFNLIPRRWVQSVAVFLIGIEVVPAFFFFIGWQSQVVAAFSGFLLVIFIFAISINLIRGQTNLECGCFGPKHSRKISIGLISHDLALLIMAFCVMLWGGGLLALDNYSFVWKRLFLTETFLPLTLICAGLFTFLLLVRQLYQLLLLIPLDGD